MPKEGGRSAEAAATVMVSREHEEVAEGGDSVVVGGW
jgi:hypothetical protein